MEPSFYARFPLCPVRAFPRLSERLGQAILSVVKLVFIEVMLWGLKTE